MTTRSESDVEAEAVKTQHRHAHPDRLLATRTRGLRRDAIYLPSTISGGIYARHFTLAGFRDSIARLMSEADASR